jgi:hypothetical protein
MSVTWVVRLLPVLAVLIAIPAIADDDGKKNKQRNRSDEGSRNRSRSTDWERRTDDEWRRYTDSDVQRRTTDRTLRRETERMRGLDKNSDGVVTREEWRGNNSAFSRLDRDGDGVLTSKDRDMWKMRARPFGTDSISRRNDRMRVRDRNGDGVITQDEWRRR